MTLVSIAIMPTHTLIYADEQVVNEEDASKKVPSSVTSSLINAADAVASLRTMEKGI